MSELAGWDSFYVIVGSAAGALIGLQFVVVTLIADRPHLRVAEAGAAFCVANGRLFRSSVGEEPALITFTSWQDPNLRLSRQTKGV